MADYNDYEVFFKNAGNALKTIGALPSSYIYRFPEYEDSFIMSTGIHSTDENWAWIKSSSYSKELLTEVIKIFESKSLKFMWPIFPEPNIQMESDMDELGLLARTTFSAMIFDSNTDFARRPDVQGIDFRIIRVINPKDALLWADTCWKGFTEERESPQPEIFKFAENAVLCDKLYLSLGYIENKPVGAFMLCRSQGLYISHFSILPKLRSLGIGSLFMNEIMNYNNSIENRFIVLLATKTGKGFYEKFGFRSIAEISIRSFSEKI